MAQGVPHNPKRLEMLAKAALSAPRQIKPWKDLALLLQNISGHNLALQILDDAIRLGLDLQRARSYVLAVRCIHV